MERETGKCIVKFTMNFDSRRAKIAVLARARALEGVEAAEDWATRERFADIAAILEDVLIRDTEIEDFTDPDPP